MINRLSTILKLRWQSLTRRRALEADLDDELRFHLESVAAAYQREGLPEQEAWRRARREFGGVEQIKEETRDQRGWGWLEDFITDVRYAMRNFRQSPGFVVTVVTTIALGIGFNAGLFSLLYSLMLRPVPVPDARNLYNVYMATRGDGPRATFGFPTFVSWDEFKYFRAMSRTAEIGGIHEARLSWKGREKTPVRAQLVSDNLLPLMGVAPVAGRFFHSSETSTIGSGQVVVLSYGAWQNWFGGEPSAIGRTMILNRTLFTIIGVAPEGFQGPHIEVAEVWIPLTMQGITRPDEVLIKDPNAAFIQMFARTKPGYSHADMDAEMKVLAPRSLLPHAPKRKVRHVSTPMASYMNNPMFFEQGGPIIAVLFLGVTLILLVACANVANLLLARGMARRREMAIRLAIGAGRGRILRQMLAESMLLSLVGGAIGLSLGQLAATAFFKLLPTEEVGVIQLDLSPDVGILTYAFAVSILTGMVFGLAPLLQAWRTDLQVALKTEGLVAESRRQRFWLQHGLVAAQVAVCLVLLVSAGLLLRGWQHADVLGTGVATRGVLVGYFDLRQQQFTPKQAQAFHTSLREAVAAMPQVKAASLSSLPPYGSRCTSIARLLSPSGDAGAEFAYGCENVDEDFLAATGIELRRGRFFTSQEFRTGAKVTVIDEDFERRYLKGREAIGARIRLGDRPVDDHEIIGVVTPRRVLEPFGDEHYGMAYTPIVDTRWLEAVMIVKYSGPARDLERALHAEAARLDGNVAVHARTIEELYSSTLTPVIMAATLSSTLGVIALVMSVMGIFATVSFSVSRRLKEVGIRMALGAGKRNIVALLLRQGMLPVFLGAGAGIALAAAAAQVLRAMLFGLSPFDPLSFLGTAAILLAAGAIAAWIPARRAVRVDPMVTLRYD